MYRISEPSPASSHPFGYPKCQAKAMEKQIIARRSTMCRMGRNIWSRPPEATFVTFEMIFAGNYELCKSHVQKGNKRNKHVTKKLRKQALAVNCKVARLVCGWNILQKINRVGSQKHQSITHKIFANIDANSLNVFQDPTSEFFPKLNASTRN